MVFGINLIGLSIGLTACLFMFLYIKSEISFDKFHPNGDRIARVIMDFRQADNVSLKGNFTSARVLPKFSEVFPEIESGTRVFQQGMLVYNQNDVFEENNVVYVDSTFFSVFSGFKLLNGSVNEVLNEDNKIVISETAAIKYFGSTDVIGKTIQMGVAKQNFVVSGVSEDAPPNSQIQYHILSSFNNLQNAREDTYFNANYTTYLQLKNNVDLKNLETKINDFMIKETQDLENITIRFELEPFWDIHLHSPYAGMVPSSNIKYIYISGGIAILILLIASFTYINLSTVRSMERAKEVGIRKVAGASKNQIFWQFIFESLYISFISLVLSLILIILTLPYFNELLNINLTPSEVITINVIFTGIGIISIITLLAGVYPAMILSNFLPIKILKGSYKNSNTGVYLRKGLTTFQFVISCFLICATVIMYQQLKFIQNKDMGFDKEQVVVLHSDNLINKQLSVLKNELKRDGTIKYVSATVHTPMQIMGGYGISKFNQPDELLSVTANAIDEEYLSANGIQLVSGESISNQDIETLKASPDGEKVFKFLINETAAQKLQWSNEEAIGQKVNLNYRNGIIIGVVKDFHFHSIHNPITSLVLFSGDWFNTIMIKVQTKNMDQTLSHIEKVWKNLAPHRPFQYSFLDEQFELMYKSEQRTGKIIFIFTFIAITLACLGLFGLSSYNIIIKSKEIGIRKVLGSSILNIVQLLSSGFMKMVILSGLIAIPIAGIIMHEWLNEFAYKVELEWWMFVLSLLIAVLISFLTVVIQSLKAALTNPINVLRDE